MLQALLYFVELVLVYNWPRNKKDKCYFQKWVIDIGRVLIFISRHWPLVFGMWHVDFNLLSDQTSASPANARLNAVTSLLKVAAALHYN